MIVMRSLPSRRENSSPPEYGSENLVPSMLFDEYGEVKEWICNTCRFDKKETTDWVLEGPAHINRASVISQNHYELPVVNPQVIQDLPESTTRELERNPPLRLGGLNN